MYALTPFLQAHTQLERQEVIVITLRNRLATNVSEQEKLRTAAISMLQRDAPKTLSGAGFRIERRPYHECLSSAPLEDSGAFYAFCEETFGREVHLAGGLTDAGGCFVVMRSERQDDASKPLLEAMRKATTQFSGRRPSFIAVQFQEISAPDLLLPHLRRRAAILSYALFGHYGGNHVNATYFCGFAAVSPRNGQLGAPAFIVTNPQPKFPVNPQDASTFLVHIPDAEFAEIIGAPLPASSISHFPL